MAIRDSKLKDLAGELGLDQKLSSSFGSGVTVAREVTRSIGAQTGILSLDLALGGGLASGLVEISGKDSVGKTALLGRIIAETQSNGRPVALVVGDYLDIPYLENLGVYGEDLVLFKSADPDLEELMVGFLNHAPKAVLTIDSLNGIRPEVEDPGAWNELMLYLLDKLRQSMPVDACMVTTSQVRTKRSAEPGRLFSSGTDTSARAFKDLFETRLELSRVEVGDYHYTMGVDIRANGLSRASRYLELPATKGHGVEVELDLVRVAKAEGVVDLRGPRMFFKERFLGMGERGAAQLLMRDRGLRNLISLAILQR